MNEVLFKFLESTLNYKKLRRSREKRNLSMKVVADKAGITEATLQRYETGNIQKIPVDVLKKLCEIYGTDYRCYYGWSTLPFLGTVSGIVLSMLYGVSIGNIYNGSLIGIMAGYTAMIGGSKLFEELSNKENDKKNNKEIILSYLTDKEKEEYQKYKEVSEVLLGTNQLEDIKEEAESLFFTTYMLHLIRKKIGANPTKLIEPTELESLDKEELEKIFLQLSQNNSLEKTKEL